MCPANNRPIAQVQQGTVEDLDACVKAGKEAWQVGTSETLNRLLFVCGIKSLTLFLS